VSPTIIGLLAGALTTGAWLPQIRRTWRTRSADDISWGYLGTMALGMGLWLAYGVVAGAPAVVVTNVATLLLIAGLTSLKSRAPEALTVPERDLEPAG
jgi:MtN3 and saliva related transmembrane protein